MANEYKFTVRFSAEEVEELRRMAGDASLPRYIRGAALRDTRSRSGAREAAAREPFFGDADREDAK